MAPKAQPTFGLTKAATDCDLKKADPKTAVPQTDEVSRAASQAKRREPSAREVLALNMIRLRGELGWSQEALAFEAGLHRTFVAHVERQARNISLDNIERIAVALGVKVGQLLTSGAVEVQN